MIRQQNNTIGACLVRSGHDYSDKLQVTGHAGKKAPVTVQYEEFAYEGVRVLRAHDGAGFAVAGEKFPGRVAIAPPTRGFDRRFRIRALASSAPTLLGKA